MASLFGHAFTAAALGYGFPNKVQSFKFFILAITCSVIPDADVLAFSFGIPYEHVLGHRGFFHSLVFAFLLSLFITYLFYYKSNLRIKSIYILFFFICSASHSLLDAMTTGGLGVAFFSPFNNARYFFPWRPIKVAPIGVSNFFSVWGIQVLLSELVWIGIPALMFMLITKIIKRKLK